MESRPVGKVSHEISEHCLIWPDEGKLPNVPTLRGLLHRVIICLMWDWAVAGRVIDTQSGFYNIYYCLENSHGH